MNTLDERRTALTTYRRWSLIYVLLTVGVVALQLLSFSDTTDAFVVPIPITSQQRGVGASSRALLAESFNASGDPNESNKKIKIRAAVYQPPISKDADETTEQKENPLKVLKEVADVLQLASRCAIDIVQFPELFLNGGFFSDVTSGNSTPLDRESYALNIVGNLCSELNVACSIGYAESGDEKEKGCYSSLAIFHADGSRAGNYRCVNLLDFCDLSSQISFEKGHPLVESMPISLLLPARPESPTLQESIMVQEQPDSALKLMAPREIKIGAMCSGDLSMAEHARYLARSGANLFLVCGSLVDEAGSGMARHILPARSMENQVPILFSNYVNEEETMSECFVGQSAILSADGIELVRAPKRLDGDMPSDEGYFLPCEMGGALYAADLNLTVDISDKDKIGASIEQWDIAPRIDQLGGIDGEASKISSDKTLGEKSIFKSKGFGREVVEVLEQSKKKKLRLKKI